MSLRSRPLFAIGALVMACSPVKGDSGADAAASNARSGGSPLSAIAHVDSRQVSSGAEFAIRNERGRLFAADRFRASSVEFVAEGVRLAFGSGRAALQSVSINDVPLAKPTGTWESDGNRVARRSGDLVEWWVVGSAGFEQGWTIERAPGGQLRLEVAVEGAVVRLSNGELAIESADGSHITASTPIAFGGDGRSLEARWVDAGPGRVAVIAAGVEANETVYIDPVYTAAQLLSSSLGTPAVSSDSIAIDGDTLLVGRARLGVSGGAAGTGAVYTRTGSTWTLQATLIPPEAPMGWDVASCGYSVAIAGNVAFLGCPSGNTCLSSDPTCDGPVPGYVESFYRSSSGAWSHSSTVTYSTVNAANFGWSLAVSGTTLLVGQPEYDSSATTKVTGAYAFSFDPATGIINPATIGKHEIYDVYYGAAVAMSGSTYVMSNCGGALCTSPGVVAMQSLMPGYSGISFQPIVSPTSAKSDLFGNSLALTDTWLAVGAPAATGGGAVYTFKPSALPATPPSFVATPATYYQPITPPETTTSFGQSVALRGNRMAIGASAAVYLYDFTGTNWSNIGKVATPAPDLVNFGHAVALSPTTLGVNAYGLTTGYGSNRSAAYAFVNTTGNACATGADCDSGFCSGGVCCTSACTGSCQSCLASQKGTGADGTCGPVADGTDPAASCTTGVCIAGACTPKLGNGVACAHGYQCSSGNCVDGVCCDGTCTGGCVACTAKLKGTGADGVCGAVVAGTNPKGACVKDAGYPASCKSDGFCDGKGACDVYASSSTVCGAATCSAGMVKGSICNGGGTCASSSAPCDPYTTCAPDGVSCATSCMADTDCVATHYCNGSPGVCVLRVAAGGSCSTDHECVASNAHCVDGVCCENSCSGQCSSCALKGAEGTCRSVTGDPVGGRAACDGKGTPCAGTCSGADPLTCTYPGAETSCGSVCAGSHQTTSMICDSKGVCVTGTTTDCSSNFACDSTSNMCKTSCSAPADCANGFTCTSGACVPAGGPTCSTDGTSSKPSSPAGAMPVLCSPFLCDMANGVCYESCTATSQCATGYSCDTMTSRCVALGGSPSSQSFGNSGGCGCEVPGRSGSRETQSAALAFAAIGLTVSRRRRRSGASRV
jgi:hypothetical protein